ncbi:hypothetical protein D1007_53450 [Hordeum vulgare]|nr:hypothetical protein D1007_53450 [Hordeum vulgare]
MGDLRELEEGGPGVGQAVDVVPGEQLPPPFVPFHCPRASAAQHLQGLPFRQGEEGVGSRKGERDRRRARTWETWDRRSERRPPTAAALRA